MTTKSEQHAPCHYSCTKFSTGLYRVQLQYSSTAARPYLGAVYPSKVTVYPSKVTVYPAVAPENFNLFGFYEFSLD